MLTVETVRTCADLKQIARHFTRKVVEPESRAVDVLFLANGYTRICQNRVHRLLHFD